MYLSTIRYMKPTKKAVARVIARTCLVAMISVKYAPRPVWVTYTSQTFSLNVLIAVYFKASPLGAQIFPPNTVVLYLKGTFLLTPPMKNVQSL